jgi:hypothetical protein
MSDSHPAVNKNTPMTPVRWILVRLTLPIAAASLVLTGTGLAGHKANAQTGHAGYLAIAPPIPNSDREPASAIYYTWSAPVNIGAGPVWLASTLDGAALLTDDRAELEIERPDGTQVIWSHNFASAGAGGPKPLERVDLRAYFQTGAHTVTLRLISATPGGYGSTAYVLGYHSHTAGAARVELASTPAQTTPTARPPVSATPAPATATRQISSQAVVIRPTAAPVQVTATRSQATRAASPAPTTRATTDARAGPVVGIRRTPVTIFAAAWPPLLIAAGIVFTALGFAWVLLRRRPRQPREPLVSGMLYLRDIKNGEAVDNIDLSAFQQPALILCVEPLEVLTDAPSARIMGRISARHDSVCLLHEVLPESEAGAATSATPNPRELGDGVTLTLAGRLTLTYRSPLAAAPAVENMVSEMPSRGLA